jgi:hypothetical protein
MTLGLARAKRARSGAFAILLSTALEMHAVDGEGTLPVAQS